MPTPLEGETRRSCEATYEQLSEQGYRTLAVAYRAVPVKDGYRADDETALTLAGFLAFVDPPLADARDILQRLRRRRTRGEDPHGRQRSGGAPCVSTGRT